MPSILLTGPAIEPWSVAEAKSFLRAENDDDDTVIASLIVAARNQVEARRPSARSDRWSKRCGLQEARLAVNNMVALQKTYPSVDITNALSAARL